MTSYKGKPVDVFTDAFGRYHATVTFPDSGYGNYGELNIERHWDSIRAAARRAIRKAILDNEVAPGTEIAPVRIEVVKTGVYGSNVWYSVTFAEKK